MQDLGKYFGELIHSLVIETDNIGVRTLFVNTNNLLLLDKYQDEVLSPYVHTYQVVKINKSVTDKGPFYPFLDIIKSNLRDLDDESLDFLLNHLMIYFPHRALIHQFIKGRKLRRKEDIVDDEIDYEKSSIVDSIKKLFLYCFKDNSLILVINNLNSLQDSSIEFIKSLLTSKGVLNAKILLILSLNMEEEIVRDSDRLRFIIDYSKENNNFDFYFSEKKIFDPDDEVIESLPLNYFTVKGKILLAENMMSFFAFKDAQRILDSLGSTLINSRIILDDDDSLKITMMSGDCSFYTGDYDTAAAYYNTLLSMSVNAGNMTYKIISYQKIGYTYFKKLDYDNASKFIEISRGLTETFNNDRLKLKSYLLFFIIEDKRRALGTELWNELFGELIKLARKLKMVNTIVYCYTNPFGIYSNYSDGTRLLHLKGIRIARRNKNLFRLARSYHTMGMAYAVQGNYDKVVEYYKKSLKYNRLLRDEKGLVYIYNGLGFFNYLTGQYEEAHASYIKALKHLKNISDYHELCMTYFNVSLNMFLYGDYNGALMYALEMMRIMKLLNIKNLAYHSAFGIYSYIGVLYLLIGDTIPALQFYTKIRMNGLKPFPGKNEEYFMYELLLSLMSSSSGDSGDALYHFHKAEFYLNKKNDVISYFYPRYLEILHDFFVKNGDDTSEIVKIGKLKSAELNNKYFIEIFDAISEGRRQAVVPFKERRHNFKMYYESCKIETGSIALHKKINEINMLYLLQSVLNGDVAFNEKLNQIINILKLNLNIDFAVFYEQAGGGVSVVSGENGDEIADKDSLVEIAKNQSGKLLINTDELKFSRSIGSAVVIKISTLSGAEYILTCCKKKANSIITYNEIKVLDITAAQLSMLIDREQKQRELVKKNLELESSNEKLLTALTKDPLTDVYNRLALYKKIEDEERNLASGIRSSFVVLFVDLDNFKFYNENFGHSAGDIILMEFCFLLKKATRNVDFIARFGGDEFVVLLPDTELKIAEVIARRILKDVSNKRGFIDKIGISNVKDADIPLSCSIGIADYQKGDTLTTLILQADKALYRAKKDGKNRYYCHSEF